MEKVIHSLYTLEASATLINQYPNLSSLEGWKRHPIKGNTLIMRDTDEEYIKDIYAYMRSKCIPCVKGSL